MAVLRCCGVSAVLFAVLCALLPSIMRELLPVLDKHGKTRGVGIVPASHRGTPWGFTHDQIPQLKGKTAVVTGANTGLGYSSALFLARAGARVVVACRSVKRCEDAAARIRANHSEAAVTPMQLDLASFKSVRDFAAKLRRQIDRIDTLMLNAGVSWLPYQHSEDGIEITFQVNHVAHQLLTDLVLPLVEKAAPSTIVVVSSAAHWDNSPKTVNAVPLSLEEVNDEAGYEAWLRYGVTKLANVFMAQELAQRLQGKGVYVNSIHPGLVDTEIVRNLEQAGRDLFGDRIYSAALAPAVDYIRSTAWQPDDACLTQLYTAVSPEIFEKKITGRYFHPVAREVEPDVRTRNATLQTKLWKFTEALINDPPKRA
eukprot:TRINITY_DN17902_c0_g1_i1.p1 TRINITY_DN17902_c0_g1~~TRINITY_DN17902_c0_g1_i1.p1  ORF type:complete len:398 (+),score=134.80 TRINITY_DN17902_c0_g1_i1:86-1195(+)